MKWKLTLDWHDGTREQKAGVGLDLSLLDQEAYMMHLRSAMKALYRHMLQKYNLFPNQDEKWEDFEKRSGVKLRDYQPLILEPTNE